MLKINVEQSGGALRYLLYSLFEAGVAMVPSSSAHSIISCDVFDTLLLRDFRSERRRFSAHAALASARLFDELGVKRSAAVIASTRLLVQRNAYRALDLAGSGGDTHLDALIDATANILNLNPEAKKILKDAELSFEMENLRPNRRLLDWLANQSMLGKQIIAVSDIYYNGATVRELLDTLAPGNPIKRIYTSSDYCATKRSGQLFERVLENESLEASEILHVGDDWYADVVMATATGLAGFHMRRPLTLRALRKADAIVQECLRLMSLKTQLLRPVERSA